MMRLPDRERWKRLDALFAAALDQPPAERDRYLRDATEGDDALYDEVWALLRRAVEAEEVLGESAAELAGPLLSSLEGDPDAERAATLGGERIGPYSVLDEIGRGGMGIVYRARDLRLDRLVALKFLPPNLTGGEAAKRRFIAEARAASATEHPNVASLHEIGETEDGRTYLVFAYYDGETLQHRIARGPLEPEEALRVARQIAAGLSAAHEGGVVHRDIKPGNVILTRDGWVKILDFGVAKVAGSDPAGRDDRMGTVAYMSPEQARGEEVDARTDLWSLGVVLHEMLTGEKPIRTDPDAAIRHATPRDVVAGLDEPDPRIPAALRPVLARLLAEDPAARYPTAAEFLRDLHRTEEAEGTRRRRRRRVGVAVVLGVAVLAAAWGAFRGGSPAAAGGLPPSIAVLPFVDLDGASEEAYFSDGITEDIASALAGIAGLTVISTTSAMQYRDSDKRLGEIAEELGVAYIVEGSVRRAEDRVRISVQLVDPGTARRLWSETYDRDLTDIFRIQSDISQRVAGALHARLSPSELRRLEVAPTENLAAYDLLLQGAEYGRRFRREDNEVALALLERAIAADSAFALAYARRAAGLALKVFQYGDGYAWADSARWAAERAIALDPELAEAHHGLALAHLAVERYDQALVSLERAATLNPGYWATINVLGVVRWRRGDYDEALRWYRAALALDPVGHAPTLSTMAGAYAFLGLFEEAHAAVEQALALQPALPLAHLNAILLHLVRGSDADAMEQGRLLITTSPGNARAWASAGTASQFGGDPERARWHFERAYEISPASFDLLWRSVAVLLGHELWSTGELERAERLLSEFEGLAHEQIAAGNQGPFLRYNLAAVHAIRGNHEAAIRRLDEAVSRGRTEHLFLMRDPLFTSLHGHPDFDGIVARNRAEMERQRTRVVQEAW
jgi:TolB-like protein/Flp pilus assembly protein TadD